MTVNGNKVTLKNIVGYGFADIFGNGASAVIGTWLLFFYTTFCGLSPIQAGSILAIARIVDSFLSPLMGYISDNFGSTALGKRFGRRRFFLLLSAPMMIIYVGLWLQNMGYWFYLANYILLEVVLAMVMIPYEALAPGMTKDFETRTKMTSSRMLCAAVATFLSAWLPGRFFALLGKDNPVAFLATGATLAVIFAIAVLVTYFTTWDPLVEETDTKKKSSLTVNPIKQFNNVLIETTSVFRIKSFFLHMIIYLFSFTGRDLVGTVYVFYVIFVMQSSSIEAASILTFGSLIGIPCNLIWPKIMSKVGPSRFLQISYCAGALVLMGYVALYSLNIVGTANAILGLYLLQFFWGIINSSTGYAPWTVYTFMPDVDEIVTKRRREGIFAGVMTFCRKTSSAAAPFITGVVLENAGFVKNAAAQPQEVQNVLIGYMCLAPIAFFTVSFIATVFFKLDKPNQSILVNEIDRLRDGGSMADVDGKTRDVVENLTGFTYEELWGNNTVGVEYYGRHLDAKGMGVYPK